MHQDLYVSSLCLNVFLAYIDDENKGKLAIGVVVFLCLTVKACNSFFVSTLTVLCVRATDEFSNQPMSLQMVGLFFSVHSFVCSCFPNQPFPSNQNSIFHK